MKVGRREKGEDKICKQSLDWNPAGYRSRDIPRTQEVDGNLTWAQVNANASSRPAWISFTTALCSHRNAQEPFPHYEFPEFPAHGIVRQWLEVVASSSWSWWIHYIRHFGLRNPWCGSHGSTGTSEHRPAPDDRFLQIYDSIQRPSQFASKRHFKFLWPQ